VGDRLRRLLPGVVLGLLGSILGSALLPVHNALTVEDTPNDFVLDTRTVRDSAPTDQDDGVLLEIVALARDVGQNRFSGCEFDTGTLTLGRVGLLGLHGKELEDNAPSLRTSIQGRGERLLGERLATAFDDLVECGHGRGSGCEGSGRVTGDGTHQRAAWTPMPRSSRSSHCLCPLSHGESPFRKRLTQRGHRSHQRSSEHLSCSLDGSTLQFQSTYIYIHIFNPFNQIKSKIDIGLVHSVDLAGVERNQATALDMSPHRESQHVDRKFH
jgi:hypothetical protein